MERGDYFTKKSGLKVFPKRLSGFVEKKFDWIALIVITLMVLFSMVFF